MLDEFGWIWTHEGKPVTKYMMIYVHSLDLHWCQAILACLGCLRMQLLMISQVPWFMTSCLEAVQHFSSVFILIIAVLNSSWLFDWAQAPLTDLCYCTVPRWGLLKHAFFNHDDPHSIWVNTFNEVWTCPTRPRKCRSSKPQNESVANEWYVMKLDSASLTRYS